MLQQFWPHLRALLILMHVVTVVLMALPSPEGGMNRKAWADPTVQGEFEAWAGRLSAMGIVTTTSELDDSLWKLAVAYMARRKAVLAPLQPYYRYCGTDQPWRMFVAPHRNPARLHVEVEVQGAWQTVYVARSRDYRWMANYLDSERFRAALFRYAWIQHQSTYRRFGEWLARHAATDFPEATRLQTWWERFRTLPPEQIRAGKRMDGKKEQELIYELDPIRRDGEAL